MTIIRDHFIAAIALPESVAGSDVRNHVTVVTGQDELPGLFLLIIEFSNHF